MEHETILKENHQFKHPCSIIIAGCSNSGKSYFVKKIIKNLMQLFDNPPNEIIFSYSENQKIYDELKNENKNIKFIQGFEYEFNGNVPTLFIIDDQMNDLVNSKKIDDLFTKGVHHKNISLCILNQNLFPQGRSSRNIRLNVTYMVIFKSPTFYSQVSCLGRQIFPQDPAFFLDAYQKATSSPYTYLFLDLHPTCNEKLMVKSKILPNESEIIYRPIKKLKRLK